MEEEVSGVVVAVVKQWGLFEGVLQTTEDRFPRK